MSMHYSLPGKKQYKNLNKSTPCHCKAACNDEQVEEKIMRRMFGFLIGITVGGLVGSTIALLLAPESGEQFRTELRSRGRKFF